MAAIRTSTARSRSSAAPTRRWRLHGHQLLAGAQPRRPQHRDDALEGRQPGDLRPHARHRRLPAAHATPRDRHRAHLGAHGRDIAFVSDRLGVPHVFVMDAEGGNVRQLTHGGFHTQPRWSPRGDTIVYTMRQTLHDLWAIAPDGSGARPDRHATRQPGGHVGTQWPAHRVSVESVRRLARLHDAGRRPARHPSRRGPGISQVLPGHPGCRDTMARPQPADPDSASGASAKEES